MCKNFPLNTKILFVLFGLFFLGGCQSQKIPILEKETPKISTSLSWETYPHKYKTLTGIIYPKGFYIEDTNALEIRSSPIPLVKGGENSCFFTTPCGENGLLISIGYSKKPDTEFLKDTLFPHVKKGKEEVNTSLEKYSYSEYYFLGKKEEDVYLIQVFEKDFAGNSQQIIQNILSSLSE